MQNAVRLFAKSLIAGSAPFPLAQAPAVSSSPMVGSSLLLICLAGVLIRAASLPLLPNIPWPDETFQIVEQASRMLGGHALVPWEYQVGARSWLLPTLFVPAVAIGRLIFHSPGMVYALVAGEMIGLSLAGALAAYRIGCAAGSRLHGLFAAFLVMIWSEAIYLSPHALPDTISANLLIITLAVSLRADRFKSLLSVGALIGATFAIRPQLAPALAVIGLFASFPTPLRRAPILALGLLGPVLLAGMMDGATWGAPFRSFLTYYRVNQGGVASAFGTSPPWSYVLGEVRIWRWFAPLILFTAGLGGRRRPVALLVVAAIFVTFSLVPHKEYRFIFPAIPTLLTLCGIGTAEIASGLAALVAKDRRIIVGVLALVWGAASAATALSPAMLAFWLRQRDTLAAIAIVNADPTSCGVAVAPEDWWWATGASRFRDDVRLFKYSKASTGAFNYLLGFEDSPRPSPDFHAVTCSTREAVCLYRRVGPCDPQIGAPLDAPPPKSVATILHRMHLL